MPAKNNSNELTLTRVYDADVEVVWDAWTDPKKAAMWWGPRGFTITTHSKNLKAGGGWHYTMHGPDGVDYPNKTVYLEVDEYKRLVYDHGANDDQPALFRVTVTFEQIEDQTRMEMTMAFVSAEAAQQAKKFIKIAGGYSTWDRLGEYLEQGSTQKEVFIINRSFDAPIEKVFEMWMDPKHFAKWMGPVGVRMDYLDHDMNKSFSEGKTTFYKMTYATGLTMFGKISYIKIDRPDYLEYTQMFTDENGGLSKHPLVPVWPDVMHTRIRFSKEGEKQTRLTLTWEPYGKIIPAEVKAFVDMKSGMSQGWTEAFDKLESQLGAQG